MELADRRRAVDSALGSLRIKGMELEPEEREIMERFARERIDLATMHGEVDCLLQNHCLKHQPSRAESAIGRVGKRFLDPASSAFGGLKVLDTANTKQGNEPGVMSCEEKARLVAEYGAATGKFSAAVMELHQRIDTSPKEEHERLDRAANEVRVKSEQARLALEQHIAAHRC